MHAIDRLKDFARSTNTDRLKHVAPEVAVEAILELAAEVESLKAEFNSAADVKITPAYVKITPVDRKRMLNTSGQPE